MQGLRVLVTGASGLLGGAVARFLIQGGHTVTTFQRRPSRVDGARDVTGSLDDPAAIASAVAGQDAIVHLAAKVAISGDRAEYERINVRGTAELLDAAREAGVSRFVQVSSPSVAHTGSAIVGAGAGPAEPELARGHYARTKAAAERLALGADTAGFAVTAVRPHLVWGPGDTQLVARVIERTRAGRLPLLGHGAALVDTVYVDNAAEAIVAALRRIDRAHGQAFVITNGEPRPIGDILAGMCLAAGVRPAGWRLPAALARAAGAIVEVMWAIRPGADEPPMTRFLAEQLSTAHWFDQRRTRAVLGWQPRVSIDEGLSRLARFYRTHAS